jgi:hypothetical protein
LHSFSIFFPWVSIHCVYIFQGAITFCCVVLLLSFIIVHLLCSFIYTHSLASISFLISHFSHMGHLLNSPHARLLHLSRLSACLSYIVLSPDTRTCTTRTHIHISPHTSSNVKSYLIMASHL